MDRLQQGENTFGRLVGEFRRAIGIVSGTRSNSPWDFSGLDILPSIVRHDLNASGGTLNRDGIRSVSDVRHYEPASFYLFVKGLEINPVAQREILRQAVVAESRPGRYSDHLRDIVNSNLDLLPADERVNSAKLFQVSRMGPQLWNEKFTQITDKLRVHHRGREKFLLAYASLMGIEHFSRYSREIGEPLNILIENWYQDPANTNCGYIIRADKGEVDFLARDFPKPDDFTLVDDTVAKWQHFRRVWGFLTGQEPSTVIIDTSRTLVIDKTSSDDSANPCPKPLY